MFTENFRRMASVDDVHDTVVNYINIEDCIHEFMEVACVGEKSISQDYCVDKINYSECSKTFFVHIDFYYIDNLETISKKIYHVQLEAVHSFMRGNKLAPLYWKYVLKGTE